MFHPGNPSEDEPIKLGGFVFDLISSDFSTGCYEELQCL